MKEEKCILRHWWISVISRNSEMEPQFQKYKGRVVLRGDIVKDYSDSYAVCTKQGSSALQTTAAKIMDILSRLPGCAGQAADAADAVSAYTQVKMEGATTLVKTQIGTSRHLDSSTTTQIGPNHGPVWKIQSFFSKGICMVTLWQDWYGKGNSRKFY